MKLSLAYIFQKMLFIGQDLKHVHVRYSFLGLLIYFWLTLVEYLVFGTHLSPHQMNTNFMGNQPWNKKTFSLVSDINVEKTCF